MFRPRAAHVAETMNGDGVVRGPGPRVRFSDGPSYIVARYMEKVRIGINGCAHPRPAGEADGWADLYLR